MPRSQFKDVLYETFEETREDISKAILKQSSLPPTYPSLGPVMFFLADSATGCIHNWSGTTWKELKLGWMLREIFSPLDDIISETRYEIIELILNNSNKEKANAIFKLQKETDEIKSELFFNNFYDTNKNEISITALKSKLVLDIADDEIKDLIDTLNMIYNLHPQLKIIKENYARKFDRFWDEDEINKICQFINQTKELLETSLFPRLVYVVNKYLKNSGIEFPLTRIDEKRTFKLVEKLNAITQGRLEAFTEFEELIKNDNGEDFSICQEDNCNNCNSMPQLCRYIFEHPRVQRDKDLKANVQRDWNSYLQSVLGPKEKNRNIVEIERKTERLVRLFAYFPQEIRSSNIFNKLQRRLKKELKLRKDYEIIELNDLSLLKELSYDNTETSSYKLYNYTHKLERLYYGGTVNKDNNYVKVDNAFIIPIRIFDAQIKGQLVILSPDKISKTDCFNAINRHYNEIKEAAKLDFYASIFEEISSNDFVNNSFAYVLSFNLPKILMLEGVITWDGKKFVNIAVKEKDDAISANSYSHLSLRFKKINEIETSDRITFEDIDKIYNYIQDKKAWDYRSEDFNYHTEVIPSDSESPFDIFLDGERVKSALIIEFNPKSPEPLILLLFFCESAEQIQISAEDIVDTIYYSFIFQHIASLYKSHLLWNTLSLHNHMKGEIDRARNTIEDSIKYLKENYIKKEDENFKKQIENRLEPNYLTLKIVLDTQKIIEETPGERFNIFKELKIITQRYKQKDKNINIFIKNTFSEKNIMVYGSPTRFTLIVDNLMRNSYEAFNKKNNPKGNIIITIYHDNDFLSLIYQDDAGGIDKTNFFSDNIFSIKTMAQDNRKKGFGLYQVYVFAKSMGWEIRYEEVENGAQFTISSIPLT